MAVQEELITKVLETGDIHPVLEAGVELDWFDTDNRKVWGFVLRHWRQHRKVPSVTALKRQFPTFEPMKLNEPLPYCVQELVKARQDFLLQEALSKAHPNGDGQPLVSRIDVLGQDLLRARRVGASSMDHDWGSATFRKTRWEDYQQLMKARGMRGIPTPWKELDHLVLGWQAAQLITVAARPGVGKTFFECITAHRALVAGKKVLLFSNEMTEQEIGRRLDALHCGISANRLRYGKLTPKELELYRKHLLAPAWKASSLIIVTDDGELDTRTGTMLVRAKVDMHEPDVVLVDGAYLMRNSEAGGRRTENQYSLSQDLKRITRSFQVPLLASVQQGRPRNEREANYGGSASTIQWADSWFQDSDVLLELVQNPTMRSDNRMRIRLLKQREGPLGELEVRWNFDSAPMDFSVISKTDGAAMVEEEQELML